MASQPVRLVKAKAEDPARDKAEELKREADPLRKRVVKTDEPDGAKADEPPDTSALQSQVEPVSRARAVETT